MTTACTAAKAPKDLLLAEYTLAGGASEAVLRLDNQTLGVQGASLTYEFLPLAENVNIAVTGAIREYEGDRVGNTLDADIFKAQVRFHYELAEGFTWYYGIGGGYMIANSGGSGPYDYDNGPLFDTEVGLRWAAGENWGLQAAANSHFLLTSDQSNSPGGLDNPIGRSFSAGLFVDF